MNQSVLILTALDLELREVLKVLPYPSEKFLTESGMTYWESVIPGQINNWNIFAAETGMGNSAASSKTMLFTTELKPDFIVFVGVAGGIKDVKIGDVVVATQVLNYESGKAADTLLPRPTSFPGSSSLIEIAHRAVTSKSECGNQSFNVKFGPIVSGEKVVASLSSDTYAFIKTNYSHAIALEMEGFGFHHAINTLEKKGVIIRGISDMLGDKKAADESGSQPLAAANAAAFSLELVRNLIAESKDRNNNENNKDKKLLTVFVSLYPMGVSDQNIWLRAGGDLSRIHLGIAGKDQWYNALTLLSNGGGGNISPKSLIDTAMSDFGNNDDLKELSLII